MDVASLSNLIHFFFLSSCLATGLNSVSTVIIEDFLRDLSPFKNTSNISYNSNFSLGSNNNNHVSTLLTSRSGSTSYAKADERRVGACRVTAVSLGVLTSGLAFLVHRLWDEEGQETVQELVWAVLGSSSGPILALFVLGFFTATANKMVCFS